MKMDFMNSRLISCLIIASGVHACATTFATTNRFGAKRHYSPGIQKVKRELHTLWTPTLKGLMSGAMVIKAVTRLLQFATREKQP